MEEDIKIINKDGEMKEITITLPKNLELSHNQRIKKINGKWYKVTYLEGSKIMEEDIKKIEYFLNQADEYFDNNIEDCAVTTEVAQAIENLINRNKYLEQRNDRINEQNIKYQNTLEKLQKETIWKSKVREKIEELEKEIEEKHEYGTDFTLIHEHEIDTNGIISVLQELLQEGDK